MIKDQRMGKIFPLLVIVVNRGCVNSGAMPHLSSARVKAHGKGINF